MPRSRTSVSFTGEQVAQVRAHLDLIDQISHLALKNTLTTAQRGTLEKMQQAVLSSAERIVLKPETTAFVAK